MTTMTPEQAKTEALARFSDPGPDHLNCAQAMVCFATLTSGWEPDVVTGARYFGGGVAGMGETCGALTGTALALGLRDMYLGDAVSDDLPDRTRSFLQELIRDFAVEFGACRCNDLTGFDLSTPEGHDAFMLSEARQRCQDYVGWMMDQITPVLLDSEAV